MRYVTVLRLCNKHNNAVYGNASESPFWSTSFQTHKNCQWHAILEFWSSNVTHFLTCLHFFFVTSRAPPFLSRYALVYHELLWDVLFSCCLHFKAHLLHIFRISFEHFSNLLRMFLLFNWFSFFLHCAPKPQAVVSLLYILFLEKESHISCYSFV